MFRLITEHTWFMTLMGMNTLVTHTIEHQLPVHLHLVEPEFRLSWDIVTTIGDIMLIVPALRGITGTVLLITATFTLFIRKNPSRQQAGLRLLKIWNRKTGRRILKILSSTNHRQGMGMVPILFHWALKAEKKNIHNPPKRMLLLCSTFPVQWAEIIFGAWILLNQPLIRWLTLFWMMPPV